MEKLQPMSIKAFLCLALASLAASGLAAARADTAAESLLTRPWPLGEAGSGAGKGWSYHEERGFSKQATGAAQLALVEKLYPGVTNLEERRRAFEKTIDYFPYDRATRYLAAIGVADADQQMGKTETAQQEFQKLLKRGPEEVDPEAYAATEMGFAGTLCEQGRNNEALPILERVANRPGLSKNRRAFARLCEAILLRDDNSARAAELLKSNVDQPTWLQGQSVALLAQVLMKIHRQDEIAPFLRRFFSDPSANIQLTLNALNIGLWIMPPEDAAGLMKIIDNSATRTYFAKAVADALKDYREKLPLMQAYVPLQKQLKQFLVDHPQPGFDKPEKPESLRAHQFTFGSGRIRENWQLGLFAPFEDTPHFLERSMERLTDLEVNPLFSQTLWEAALSISRQMGREEKRPTTPWKKSF